MVMPAGSGFRSDSAACRLAGRLIGTGGRLVGPERDGRRAVSGGKRPGGSGAPGFANPMGVAVDMKVNGFLEKNRDGLGRGCGAQAPQDKPQSAAL